MHNKADDKAVQALNNTETPAVETELLAEGNAFYTAIRMRFMKQSAGYLGIGEKSGLCRVLEIGASRRKLSRFRLY